MELLLLRSFDAAAVRMELVAAAVVRPAHTGTCCRRSTPAQAAAVRVEPVAAVAFDAAAVRVELVAARWLLPSFDLLTQALVPQKASSYKK